MANLQFNRPRTEYYAICQMLGNRYQTEEFSADTILICGAFCSLSVAFLLLLISLPVINNVMNNNVRVALAA